MISITKPLTIINPLFTISSMLLSSKATKLLAIIMIAITNHNHNEG